MDVIIGNFEIISHKQAYSAVSHLDNLDYIRYMNTLTHIYILRSHLFDRDYLPQHWD